MAAISKMAVVSGMGAMKSPRLLSSILSSGNRFTRWCHF